MLKKLGTVDNMKTDKEVFIELLKSADILYSVNNNGRYITVENSPYTTGFGGFCSCWDFNEDGKLISVGHYED
jgi:hypothetical protein